MTDQPIAIFAPMYPPALRGGGPIRSIHAIATSAPERYYPHVFTRDCDLGMSAPLDVLTNVWTVRDGVLVRYVSTRSPAKYAAGLRDLQRRRPRLLYFNSFFDPALSIFPQLLGALGWWRRARRVVAVRGEFSAAALAIKATKKRAFILLYKSLGLHRRAIWHATSPREAADIRRVMGDHATIVTRSDGGNPTVTSPASLKSRSGPLRVLFLGRLVPIKGLDDALESFRDSTSTFTFDIFGPSEDQDYAHRCRALAESLPQQIEVSFRGIVEPQRVGDLMAEYDLLVMPTHSENFGHVIGEALAAGVPVLVRDVTPWTEHIRAGGGLIVEDPRGWSAAIAAFAEATPDERLEQRRAAVNAYLTWKAALATGHLFDDLIAAASN